MPIISSFNNKFKPIGGHLVVVNDIILPPQNDFVYVLIPNDDLTFRLIPSNDFNNLVIPNNDLDYNLIPSNDLSYLEIPNDDILYITIPDSDIVYVFIPDNDLNPIEIPINDINYTLIPNSDLTYTLIPNNDLEYSILNSEGFRYILTGAQPEEFAPPSQGYVILPDFENNVGSLNPNSLGPNDGLEVSFWINPIDGYGNNHYQFLSQFTNGDNPFRLTLCQNGDCVIYTGNTLVFVEEFGSFYFDSSQNTIELIQPSNGLFLNNVEVYVLFESINSVTPTPSPTPTPTPSPTPTPTPTDTPTPTPTATPTPTPTPTDTPTPTPTETSTPTPTPTPEMATLVIDLAYGIENISFGGVTYTSDTTISVIKNQSYTAICGSQFFFTFSGTGVAPLVSGASNILVTVTGSTATLNVVSTLPEPTSTPTSTPTPTPTSTPTPTESPLDFTISYDCVMGGRVFTTNYIGGSGVYDRGFGLYDTELEALNANQWIQLSSPTTFATTGVPIPNITATYWVSIRDRNNPSNVFAKSILVDCAPTPTPTPTPTSTPTPTPTPTPETFNILDQNGNIINDQNNNNIEYQY